MSLDINDSPAERRDYARLVTALFEDRAGAEKARADLVAAGIPADDIVVADAGSEAADAPAEGFWETLKSLFIPDEDRHGYTEGHRRGGVTVAVRTDTASHDRVVDLLDRDGALDLDEQEQSWRAEGWSGYTRTDGPGSPLADARSQEPGLISPEEAPSYTRPSDATAGFGASLADHFPSEGAPPVVSPGALPETERVATPDGAYAGAAPGLSPNPGAPAVPSTADGAGAVSSAGRGMDEGAPTRVGMRDVELGRSRVRSYVTPDPRT